MARTLQDPEIQRDVCKSLLRPIIRFWLRRSRSFQEFLIYTKEVFVEVAEEEIRKTSEKVNVSRISVITGMYRQDITRIYREEDKGVTASNRVLERVIGRWRIAPEFTTKGGKPRVLSYQGEDSEFRELVRMISTAIHPGTVQFELERLRLIEKTKNGLKLLTDFAAYAMDPRKSYELLSRDLEGLLCSIEENVFDQKKIPNLHLHTEYDNVVKGELPVIRRWFIKEGKAFHKRARDFLSQYDNDLNPSVDDEEAGAKVIVGMFSHTTPFVQVDE